MQSSVDPSNSFQMKTQAQIHAEMTNSLNPTSNGTLNQSESESFSASQQHNAQGMFISIRIMLDSDWLNKTKTSF